MTGINGPPISSPGNGGQNDDGTGIGSENGSGNGANDGVNDGGSSEDRFKDHGHFKDQNR